MMLRRLVMVVGKEQLGPTRLVKSLIFLRLDARSLAPSSSVRRRLAASFSSAARSGEANTMVATTKVSINRKSRANEFELHMIQQQAKCTPKPIRTHPPSNLLLSSSPHSCLPLTLRAHHRLTPPSHST